MVAHAGRSPRDICFSVYSQRVVVTERYNFFRYVHFKAGNYVLLQHRNRKSKHPFVTSLGNVHACCCNLQGTSDFIAPLKVIMCVGLRVLDTSPGSTTSLSDCTSRVLRCRISRGASGFLTVDRERERRKDREAAYYAR